jgi:hypothetical protein
MEISRVVKRGAGDVQTNATRAWRPQRVRCESWRRSPFADQGKMGSRLDGRSFLAEVQA